MSFQQQQPPYSYGNAFPPTQMPPASGTVTTPTDPYNRFMPPPALNGQHQPLNGPVAAMPFPPAGQKATLAPPQQQQPLRQQLLTNGTGGAPPGSSSHSSRTASPAFNQQINAAYLPPSSTPSQAPSSTTANAYATPAAAPTSQHPPPPSQSSQQSPFYAAPASTNAHQQPLTNGASHPNANHLTAKLQNISLTNGPAVTSPTALNPNNLEIKYVN